MQRTEKISDGFCKRTSAHELKHRLNDHGAEAHTMYTVAFGYFSNKNSPPPPPPPPPFTTSKMSQMHSSVEQNLPYNIETLHHARTVKSSTVVIFEDTKHIGLAGVIGGIWEQWRFRELGLTEWSHDPAQEHSCIPHFHPLCCPQELIKGIECHLRRCPVTEIAEDADSSLQTVSLFTQSPVWIMT